MERNIVQFIFEQIYKFKLLGFPNLFLKVYLTKFTGWLIWCINTKIGS